MHWYKDDGIFLPMLNDTGRNIAYKSWIDSCVKDKIVCDIGAGTGFLSVLSVQAGASKVIAVERDLNRYNFTKNLIEELNLIDKIELVNEDFLNTKIKADYYLTETFGNAIFEEGILEIANHAKQFDGCFVPREVEIFIKVYESHPIFPVIEKESGAVNFQPDIDIDHRFISAINKNFNPTNKRRTNWIDNLFRELPKFTDLKLKELYKSQSIKVNFSTDFPKLEFNLPSTVPAGQYCIFWQASFNNIVMDVTNTIWSTPTRFIPKNHSGIKIYYENNAWWFEW